MKHLIAKLTERLESMEGKWKLVTGVALIVIGAILGVYVGLWLCLIGGIVQLINEVKSPEEVRALIIAVGIVRIFLTTIAGGISASLLMIPGFTAIVAYARERFLQ